MRRLYLMLGTGGSQSENGNVLSAKSTYDKRVEAPHPLHSITTVPGRRVSENSAALPIGSRAGRSGRRPTSRK